MANALYVLAFMATLAVLTEAVKPRENYCNLKSCEPNRHTLCQFPTRSKQCGKIYFPTEKRQALTPVQKTELVNIHNAFRARVASGMETRGTPVGQPAAKNLGPLRWNNELARIAQAWANQCMERGHDECRNINKFKVGQNIAQRGTTGPYNTNLTQLVEDWYNEVDCFDGNSVGAFTGAGTCIIGHYSQLVWGKTTDVGCGLVRHNGPTTKGFNRSYLVCNYGPAGNWLGEPVYET